MYTRWIRQENYHVDELLKQRQEHKRQCLCLLLPKWLNRWDSRQSPLRIHTVSSWTELWCAWLQVRQCFLGLFSQVISKGINSWAGCHREKCDLSQDEDTSQKQGGTKPMSACLECLPLARLKKI